MQDILSSSLFCKNPKIECENHGISCSFVWIGNGISYTKRRTYMGCVCVEDAEENTWVEVGKSNTK